MIISTTLALITFLFTVAITSAQTTIIHVENGCVLDDAEIDMTHHLFEPSNDANQIVENIMKTINVNPNFTIRLGDVKKVFAAQDKGKRLIIYNNAYIDRIKYSAGNDWNAIYQFAHAIAHHSNNHDFSNNQEAQILKRELSADQFAGGILFQLGATLEDIQRRVGLDFNKNGSKTYPPSEARLKEITAGWKNAMKKNGDLRSLHWYNKEGVYVLPVETPETIIDTIVGKFILVRGGTFSMGCDKDWAHCSIEEMPAHQVTLRDYYIGETEVTQAQWKAVMGNNPSNFSGCDNCPVENITWLELEDFLLKLNLRYGRAIYRLPTEAEWEYSALGGNLSKGFKYFSGSDDIDEIAWYSGNAQSKTMPVKMKASNELGLYDMCGNIREWCADWYSVGYPPTHEINPRGIYMGFLGRTIRGGSWATTFYGCLVKKRSYAENSKYNDLGFRLARTK